MPDPIACLKLLSPSLLLSPFATPDTVHQCLEGTPKNSPTAEDVGRALVGGLIPLALSIGGGKIARSAARFGAKAAARGMKQLRNRSESHNQQDKNSSTQGTNGCDAAALGMRLILGVSPFGSPILLSPVGTPEMARNLCSNPDVLVKAHGKAVDFTADLIGDVADYFGF